MFLGDNLVCVNNGILISCHLLFWLLLFIDDVNDCFILLILLVLILLRILL